MAVWAAAALVGMVAGFSWPTVGPWPGAAFAALTSLAAIVTLLGRGPLLLVFSLSALSVMGIFFGRTQIRENPLHGVVGEVATYVGRVESGPWAARQGGRSMVVSLQWRRDGPADPWGRVSGRVLLTAERAEGPDIREGDRVLFRGRVVIPRGYGNPGCRDPVPWMRSRGLDGVVTIPGPGALILLEPGRGSSSWVGAYRAAVERVLGGLPPGPGRGFVRALAMGDPGELPEGPRAALSATGTAHLLALSGLHVGAVAGLVYWGVVTLLGLLVLPWARTVDARRWAAGVTIGVVAMFVWFTGARLPTVRAGTMIAVYLAARMVGRERDLPSALCLAGLVIAFQNPWTVLSPSFQLSFAAVVSVIVLGPRLHRAGTLALGGTWFASMRLVRWLVAGLSVSLAASLGTWPVVAAHFGTWAAVAPLANILVVPPVTLILVPLALGLVALAGPWPWLAGKVALLAGGLADTIVTLAGHLAVLPGAGLSVPRPPLWVVIAWFVALGLALGRRTRGLALAPMVAIGIYALVPRPTLDHGFTVRFLDVGQGDSAHLELPGGFHMLVDTGGALRGRSEVAERALLPYLRRQRVERLDLMVLTHPHPDHYQAAWRLVDEMPVASVWIPAGDDSDGGEPWARFLEHLGAKAIPIRRVDSATEPLVVGDVTVRVLHPPPGGGGWQGNDRSVVLSVQTHGHGVLLTGDLETPGEESVLSRWPAALLGHEVLKAGHHGSTTSTSQGFLAAVSPRHVFFSVGWANRFGFPRPRVVERVTRARAMVWRSDLHGSVLFGFTGRGLEPPVPYRAAGPLPPVTPGAPLDDD